MLFLKFFIVFIYSSSYYINIKGRFSFMHEYGKPAERECHNARYLYALPKWEPSNDNDDDNTFYNIIIHDYTRDIVIHTAGEYESNTFTLYVYVYSRNVLERHSR